MSGRSSNFSFAQLSSIVRAENWMQEEKVYFTKTERIKLERALAVLNDEQGKAPFIRAMSALELYENAERGIKLQKEIDSTKAELSAVSKERRELIRECAELKVRVEILEGRTFWARLLGLFRAKVN